MVFKTLKACPLCTNIFSFSFPPFDAFHFFSMLCIKITVIASIHMELKQVLPDLITIIAPRHPERGYTIALVSQPSQAFNGPQHHFFSA